MDEIEQIRKKKVKELKTKTEIPGEPLRITDADFDETIAKYPLVVVDCWAPWCGPCQMIGPVIDELARDFAGKVVFGKLNVDENQLIASRLGVMSIPLLLIFKKGEIVDKIIGAMPKERIEEKIKSHV